MSTSPSTPPAKALPVRRADEELALRRYALTREPRLRDELIESFLPLARSLAHRYSSTSESVEDLVQVASLGLVKAIDGYDPERGRSFNAYAVPTILGELRRHFRDHVWKIHLPRSLQELTLKVAAADAHLRDVLGRAPSVKEIARHLGTSDEDVLEAIQAEQASHALSLDKPQVQGEEDSAPVIESLGGEDLGYDAAEALIVSREADLDERELRVLRLRFEDGLNQYEIGDLLGVSQMQISRIMRRALAKMLLAVQGSDEKPSSVLG